MVWLVLVVAIAIGRVVWMAWRRPRHIAQVAPFSFPVLRAGRNLPRNRRR